MSMNIGEIKNEKADIVKVGFLVNFSSTGWQFSVEALMKGCKPVVAEKKSLILGMNEY